ncbi:hypothetical protein DW757_05940 [Clostridium sp. AM29-11AC]|nr:hypothetical protein DW757_05940 [Clostridium sp. AM29-11AC]
MKLISRLPHALHPFSLSLDFPIFLCYNASAEALPGALSLYRQVQFLPGLPGSRKHPGNLWTVKPPESS